MYVGSNTARTVCHDQDFTNIVLRRRWTRGQLAAANWSTRLENDHPLYRQLTLAYHREDSHAALNYRRLEFYNGISYTVRDGSESLKVRINVGDVVDVSEPREGIAYARVGAIIRHKANDGRHFPFLVLEWFTASRRSEAVLDCPIYELQRPDTAKWQQLFPLSCVDHTANVHFVHACTRSCTLGQHDLRNRQYFRNDFFYRAV